MLKRLLLPAMLLLAPVMAQETVPPGQSNLKEAMDGIVVRLQEVGFQHHAAPQSIIDEALKTRDRSQIAQAVTDVVYSGPWSREQKIASLQGLLAKGDGETRLDAAKGLNMMGDSSGRDALLEIVRTPNPLMVHSPAYAEGEGDLRIAAAQVLGHFRDVAAKSAVMELYGRTKARELLRCLVYLGAEEAAGWMKEAVRNKPSYELLECYGLLKHRAELDRISTLKNDEINDPSIRLAAAWALARMEADGTAITLIQRYVVDQMTGESANLPTMKRAVKYLGSLDDAGARRVLEQVISQSTSPGLVQMAAVNLILNHPGHVTVARDLILAELNDTQTKLGLELAIKLAATVGDQQMTQAGEAYDRRHPEEKMWKEHGVDRSRWSPWGWAGDYVITMTARPGKTG